MVDEPKNEEAIFKAAVKLKAAAERRAYLEEACAQDKALLARVTALLQAYDDKSNLFDALMPDTQVSPPNLPIPEGPGTVIDRCKLLEKIGEGGMATVYLAEQEQPICRKVALKIIKLGMDTKQVIARFEVERQALALMDHPNVAKVLDAGATDTGRPYFVMELVQGVSITEYCDQNSLSTQERLELFVQVCHAVQHAHQKGIIHRDIKPSNVMVTQRDGTPVPKVIDFGIAKATNQRLTEKTLFTRYAHIIGTPVYMSPEQAEMSGLDIDTRTDVYSLGVLLYELLIGKTPLDERELYSGGFDEIRRRIKEEEPLKPSTRARVLQDQERTALAKHHNVEPSRLGSELKGDLDWIVMKALEKDRTRRYDTAKGLADDVRRFLNQEPVEAGAPGVGYRCRKFILRHRTVVALASLVGVTMLFATIVSLWQATVATQARNETAVSLRHARRIAYLADMSVVQSSLDNHNVGRARRLLEAYRPRPGEEDLRDFEWFHFDRLSHIDDSRMLGTHPNGARKLFAAPDGTFITAFRHVVFRKYAGHLQIWDGTSGVLRAKGPSLDDVTALALSQGGKRLAIARGMHIEIRSLDSPEVIETNLTKWNGGAPFGEGIVTMCFCADDTRLAVSCQLTAQTQSTPSTDASPLRLIDISLDRAVIPVVNAPLTMVLALAVSENGQFLAVSEGGQEVVILRLPDAVEVQRITLPTSSRSHIGLSPLAYANQDRHLVTTNDAGRIDLWDVTTGSHIRTIGRHASYVTAFACSADGRLLASSGLDQLVRLWDLETEKTISHRVLRGHEDEVWGVAFFPDGQSLVSCGRDESVRLWNLQQLESEDARWALPAGTLVAKLGPGFVAVGNAQRRWEAWDVSEFKESGNPQPTVPPRSLGDVFLALLPDGSHWLALSNPVVETQPGWGYPLTLYYGRRPVEPVTAFPEFGLSLTGSMHCTESTLFVHGAIQGEPHLLVWDLDSQRIEVLLGTFLAGDSTMAVAPDEHLVVLGDLAGDLEVVDLTTKSSQVIRSGRLNSILSLAVLPNNRSVFAGGHPGILCKLDLETGAVTDWVPASLLGIEAMALSPGATRLATGDAQGKVKLWDVGTMREVAVLGNHPGLVTGLQFREDGRCLLSLDDSELRIYRAEGLMRDKSNFEKIE